MTLVDDQEILTATVRSTARRAVFWIALVSVALILTLVGVLITGNAQSTDALAADNPGPAGAQALVEVLRAQGVDVTVTSTLDDTEAAIDDPATTTLFVYDRDVLLNEQQNTRVVGLAETLVLLDPGFDVLESTAPSVAQAGVTQGTADAECGAFAATQAGTIGADGSGYRIIDTTDGAAGCFPTGDDVYSLVRLEKTTGTTISILGSTGLLSNEFISERGNAALALNLLGENEHLVWYIPTLADIVGGTPPTIGELSPPWVTPSILIILVGGIAAAIWRGRRFGPLIVENLPVVVRSSETMRGRARLYQSNSTRLHALDALRIGTVSRLAAACGMPRAASVEEVIGVVASVTGDDARAIRALLLDTEPRTDRELVSLSDDLLELERAVATMLKPS